MGRTCMPLFFFFWSSNHSEGFTLQDTFARTFTRRWGRLPYGVPTCQSEGANLSHAHQEQFGLVNMWTGEAGNYTASLWISGRHTLPPQPQTFLHFSIFFVSILEY